MERLHPIRTSEEALHMKPGEGVTLTFDGTDLQDATRLHFTGESALFYQWKNEPDYPVMYGRIDDSLNSNEARNGQYCLEFSDNHADYPKIAYHKASFPPWLSYLPLAEYSNQWTLGISVKTENLHISESGYLRFRMEVRYCKSGKEHLSTTCEPDEVFDIPLPEGTNQWVDLRKEIVFDAIQVDSVCCIVEGEKYRGKVYVEAPMLKSEQGWNILPSFAPASAERPQFTWTGVNLSHKEWPQFEVSLNDRIIFVGPIFERCHRHSEVELPLNGSKVLRGNNQLTIKLVSNYRDALAYDLYDVGFVCEKDTFLVSYPHVVTAGKPFAVIVDIEENETVKLLSDHIQIAETFSAPCTGLNVLMLVCKNPQNNIAFSLEYRGKKEIATIERCVLHSDDGVITGTGDFVYIPNDKDAVTTHLKWYFSNNIGNLITIRPTYRWCGTRVLDEELWRETTELLNRAGIKYAHMLDGRELSGCDANPSAEAIAGTGFLGRQLHELDGLYVYWGIQDYKNDASLDTFLDLFIRRYRTHGQYMNKHYVPENLIEKQGYKTLARDLTVPDDMEQVADYVVQQLSDSRYDATRHTGPTTLFKYFYQAGYEWVGAELMYNSTEIVSAALRGASKGYNRPITGAHHAVQWSTTPHDTQARYRRYRLALFISYLQGISEINTEEGLWHLEEYYATYHRFSDACKNHLKQQQDFYRYTCVHSRTGKFYTPVAFLHGRFDGWTCFVRDYMWGKYSFRFSDAEKAWDLLKWFYPRAVLDTIYKHGCTNEPHGFYTGTPYGNVDVIPIEQQEYSDYSLLVAPGYNKALEEDFDKIHQYVENGGTLIIGWPQTSVTTNRVDVVELNHTYIYHKFCSAVFSNPIFTEETYQGHPISVAPTPMEAEILLKTDQGSTLVYQMHVGSGTVIVVNAKEYAGSEGVMAAYQEIFRQVVPKIIGEELVYAEGNDDVQFAVYPQSDGSYHVYFMAVDWFHESEALRTGVLKVGRQHYAVGVSFGTPVKVVVNHQIAVWSQNPETEILSVLPKTVLVQGSGEDILMVAREGVTEEIQVDFSECALQIIEI